MQNFLQIAGKTVARQALSRYVFDSIGHRAREMDSLMNTKQHISNCFQRLMSVVLPGGTWHLGKLYAEWCKAEPVAVRAMKPQVMPCRLDAKPVYRRNRQA